MMKRTCPQVQPWLYGYDARKEVAQAVMNDANELNGTSGINGVNGVNGINKSSEVNGLNGTKGTHTTNGTLTANGSLASYTASEALLEALVDADVTHLFVNLGSDHPALLEAMSKRKQQGRETLQIITAANEFVGLCACQGFFQASGKMQAILVHVDCGTLAMAGAIHNVARARIPVLMVAGTSPITEENEIVGTRNVCFHVNAIIMD
jgi:hypothetical protein